MCTELVSNIGDIVRTSAVVVPASSTTLGSVPPHGGTAWAKLASNTTTTATGVPPSAGTSRTPPGHLTVPGVLHGSIGSSGNAIEPPVSEGSTADDFEVITFVTAPAVP